MRLLLDRPATDKGHPVDKIVAKVCSFLGAGALNQFVPKALVQTPATKVISKAAEAKATAAAATEKAAIVSRASMGATLVLQACCAEFGEALFHRLAALWRLLTEPLGVLQAPPMLAKASLEASGWADEEVARAVRAVALPAPVSSPELVTALASCRALLPHLPPAAADAAFHLLPRVLSLLLRPQPEAPVEADQEGVMRRALGASCVAAFCACQQLEARSLHLLHLTALPALGSSDDAAAQLGATAAVRQAIGAMGLAVLPYAMPMLPHLIRALSSRNVAVRNEAAAAFASVMPLLPLEDGTRDPPGMPPNMRRERAEAREAVAPLLGKGKPARFELPMPVAADLRDYQREGIDWLGFLWRFGLHGVLSDDMGLGKTLQVHDGSHQCAWRRAVPLLPQSEFLTAPPHCTDAMHPSDIAPSRDLWRALDRGCIRCRGCSPPPSTPVACRMSGDPHLTLEVGSQEVRGGTPNGPPHCSPRASLISPASIVWLPRAFVAVGTWDHFSMHLNMSVRPRSAPRSIRSSPSRPWSLRPTTRCALTLVLYLLSRGTTSFSTKAMSSRMLPRRWRARQSRSTGRIASCSRARPSRMTPWRCGHFSTFSCRGTSASKRTSTRTSLSPFRWAR